ncbi:MAG TPA: glycoside hydrolase family 172 protein [Candidatus Sulfotelmatobacter sp.]|nr:glycoside hydrolase family 172 protein [Candidatus Sulfotelmatobacter sp.]
MKSLRLGLIALLFTRAAVAFAQSDFGNPLNGLDTLKDFQSMRASSTDPNWRNGNGDSRPIAPGQTLTLAELAGPGRIVHFWNTISDKELYYSRLLSLRIYWDGETNPSVQCPIGDFFGVGNGIDQAFDSLPVSVSSNGRGRNCYWPMPFKKAARITVTNDGKQPCENFYYQIDWQKLRSLPRQTAYFHAMYRQEYPCVMGRNYLIADIRGRGQYVGTVLSVCLASPKWFGEGNEYFFVDGENEPNLRGTGTEDYFCEGWGFYPGSQPFYGASYWEGDAGNDVGNLGSFYRWHIPDPVSFRKSLRLEIEHRGGQIFPDGTKTGFIERDDLFSSVAFWYQVEPHKSFPDLPPGPDRLPLRDVVLITSSQAKSARHSDAPVAVEHFGKVNQFWQFWLQSVNTNGWMEIPFQTGEPLDSDLVLKMVHSWNSGIYRVLLDGNQLAQIDFYASDPTAATDKLGPVHLEPGDHVLRFECAGKSPESMGCALGFGSLISRAVAYSRPANLDLRTLQKH